MAPSMKAVLATALLTVLPPVAAIRELVSSSLSTCITNSKFSADLFDVSLIPSNSTFNYKMNGVSTITGYVLLDLNIYAYGLKVYSKTVDPCLSTELKGGMCPMQEGPIDLTASPTIPADTFSNIPGIAYTVPNLDASFQVIWRDSTTGVEQACVQAELSNGKTVDQKGVAWVLAVTSGLALVASAVTSGLGHSNTAAHVAANALGLFGYFQAQAFIGMTAVDLPPIVTAWTQNFQWSMGIIRVGFLQSIATWYQRSTGGTASQILANQDQESVQVQKRSLSFIHPHVTQALQNYGTRLLRRADSTDEGTAGNPLIVRGIERVGFVAGIEPTNIFFTGYTFFIIFVVGVILGVVAFKFICEALVKAGHLKNNKFQDFRNGWTTVLKGIMYRIVLIGFPQMVVLCFWEFTRDDSAGEVVLAVFTVFTMIGILGWAGSKVIRLARRSIAMHKNPAYILYSDPVSLNKWGFLYVQFKATAYYFIVPMLIYLLFKGMLIAFGQPSGVAQAIGLVIIEAVYLIVVSILTPYMDKKTNAFNISISVINFVSALFLLMFSNVFGQPQIVNGVMGVIFFIYNAAFSTILLVIVLVASFFALTSKNPDTRYQPMRDDRGSFIKSQSQLTTELDALGATARGESKLGFHNGNKGSRLDEDDDSLSGSDSAIKQQQQYNSNNTFAGTYYPSESEGGRHMPPNSYYHQQQPQYHQQSTRQPAGRDHSRTGSMTSGRFRSQGAPPAASPWQRGAGYD